MTSRRLDAALALVTIALLASLVSGAALADERGSSPAHELALKVKGWHCDG